ncbi:hypothetical protein N7493_010120 [Penicillium malachiteum]|uniref:Uncharacterized protein n=1 Tax=Penicillium malachiteum TaxID=1324776 RepID=A0AAD6MRB7_9EURO|nr:hypothetical protein N7493_010120 [Penicillium malachiteum]
MPVPNHMSMHPWNYVMESSYPSHYGGTPEYNAPPSLPGSCSLPYFICLHCGIPRSTKLIYESVCVYCLGYEQKYCMYGDHEEERRNFYDGTGVEQVRCNNCRDDDEEDEQLPEAKKETAPESSDDSDDNDTDLSDTSSAVIQLNAPVNTRKVPQGVQTVQGLNKTDAIFIDAPVNAQKEPRGVQGHDKPDIILVDAPGEVQKDPQEVVQMNTQTDDIPKEAQHDAQGIAQENQPDMVLVDVQGDDILLSDVPGDVQESIKSDTPADTQVKIQGNPQVDAQGDTANFKTGEEEIPHKRSPEPAESVKIKKENDDSVQFESLNRIPVAPIGGDIASDPILID